jgi:hypothetical protein
MSMTTPQVGPAGSRRFWITVCAFALANGAIWIGYDHFVRSHRPALLEVRQAAPVDQAEVGGRPTFWWTFNLDVAPGKPGEPPPGVITPQVPGRWVWDNPRTLAFAPDQTLPRATSFTVKLLPERLRTAEGFALNKPWQTTVHTEPLAVREVRQAGFDDQDRQVLAIDFNDEVVPSEVLSHITLQTGDGKPLAFGPHGNAAGHTVQLLTDPVAPQATASSHVVHVKIAPGFSGRSGPLGLPGTFESMVALGSDLAATAAHARYSYRGEAQISIEFNNDVDLAVLKSVLSIEPAVPFTMSRSYRGDVELTGTFQPATRYTLKIAPAPAGVARHACPRPDTLSVFLPDASPSVWFEHDDGYLGTAGNRTLLAHAVNVSNVRVTLTRIYDNNLVVWRNVRERYGADLDRPVATKDLRLAMAKNKTQDIHLSLDNLLPADAPRDGVYLMRLESRSNSESNVDDEERYSSRWNSSAMVTLSDIGLTAKKGRLAVTAWATSLRTAEPLADVRVRVYSNKNQFLGEATSNADGVATVKLSPAAEGEEASVVLADRPAAPADARPQPGSASAARDLTWLDLRTSGVSFGQAETAGAAYLRTGHEAFIYTDRGVYRPGETVHLRAIVRGPDGVTPPSFPVRWQFRRPDLHDWKSVNGSLDADGAISLDMPLPADLPTGHWSVLLGLPGKLTDSDSFGQGEFGVEEFMPNRMQVQLSLKGEGAAGDGSEGQRFTLGKAPLSAQVQADYLFGKPVTERPAQVVARIDPMPFKPSKWSDWAFGDSAGVIATLDGKQPTGHRVELAEQELDGKGHATFDLSLDDLLEGSTTAATASNENVAKPSRRNGRRRAAPRGVVERKPGNQSGANYVGPWQLTVTASVTETGGRGVSATRKAQLDAVPWYVALRARSTMASIDAPNTFDIALVKGDGTAATGDAQLEATLYREDWNSSFSYENGHYVYHSTRLLEAVQPKISVTVAGGKGSLDIQPPSFGSYVLSIRNPQTGGMTSLAFYAGGGAWDDNISRENPERLELLVQPLPSTYGIEQALNQLDVPGLIQAIADLVTTPAPRKAGRLRVGDLAQVIVRSPFAGRLLLSVETDDVVRTKVIEMPASHMAVPIEFTDACRPNAYITATVLRPVDPDDATWKTHRAVGTLRVPMDNGDRRLEVRLAAPQEIRPATSLGVDVLVTDSSGAPVPNAAVTVAAVDEGICQLTGFKTPDPFEFFYRQRALGVGTADLFSQLMPEVPKVAGVSTVGGDADAYDPRHQSPVGAKRVKPVALVCGVLHTDAQGVARADFSVPQFTGKLRIMGVASAGPDTGNGESAALVRSPLLVQSSWPRFAAPQDKFQVPIVLFNNTPNKEQATVSLQVDSGPLRFGNNSELRLDPIALSPNGQTVRLVDVTASASAGVSHVVLMAKMGDEFYQEEVEIPVRPASPNIQVGGYALASPGKVTEISMPNKMLDGTSRFDMRVTPRPLLELPQGLDYLDRYPYGCLEQTTSTLFPLAYLSDIGKQIAPGMFDAGRVEEKIQAGITRLIGMQTANGGLAMWPAYRDPWPWGTVYAAHFLIEAQTAGHPVPEEFRKQVLSYVRGLLNQSSDQPETVEIQAYACYVLALAGKPERPAMSRLSEIVKPSGSGAAESFGQARLHLASAWLASGRRDLAESLLPQAIPSPRTHRALSGNLASPTRDRAILIDTLLAISPEHPALPDLVQQLADSGRKGQWRSTQDTAFAVLALGRYLRLSNAASPYATAQLMLDGKPLCDATDAKPLLWSAGDGKTAVPDPNSKLTVAITGPADAKAYVSWLQTGVPMIPPAAADHGMTIRRRLLLENGKPLALNQVHSGDLVQVELSIQSPTPLEHIAIDDLLPAGLEIENPRLATSAAEGDQPRDGKAVNKFHDTRLDIRDDRLVLIGDLTEAGTGTYHYTARAVTPGKFILPPVHGECMYDIGTNSLSDASTFEVLPAGAPQVAAAQQ